MKQPYAFELCLRCLHMSDVELGNFSTDAASKVTLLLGCAQTHSVHLNGQTFFQMLMEHTPAFGLKLNVLIALVTYAYGMSDAQTRPCLQCIKQSTVESGAEHCCKHAFHWRTASVKWKREQACSIVSRRQSRTRCSQAGTVIAPMLLRPGGLFAASELLALANGREC